MSTLLKHIGFSWLLSLAIGTFVTIAPVTSEAQTCNATVWSRYQYYAAGSIVSYNGGHYRAKYANPGYIPTVSTYYWAPYSCSGVAAPSTSQSADGTTVPSATQIVDASGNIFTISSSRTVLRNGQAAGYSANVAKLIYKGGKLYQQNDAGGFWYYENGGWIASSNPLSTTSPSPSPAPSIPAQSADGTTVPSAAQIVDASGNIYTISASRTVLRNGQAAGYSANVAKLIYKSGKVYQQNDAGGFWYYDGNGGWIASSNPIVTSSPSPAPAPAPSPSTSTCSYTNWVSGQYYNAGAIVLYQGSYYRADYANPGYIPTVSTYFWEPTACRDVASTPSPSPAPAPTPSAGTFAGSAIPLPSRVIATYHPLWTGMRITSVPTSYNQIYLFHAVPAKDHSGRAEFHYGYVVNAGDISFVRSRGQRVVLTFGGAGHGLNFSNRTQSQNFVNSIVSIINSLGGTVDGLDFNNFEANIGSSATEMVWIGQQLKARYGRNFSISCPPAPDGNYDPVGRAVSKAMVNAGVMDYAGPQYYDASVLVQPAYIERLTDEWVAHLNGDASKVMVGFGANYHGGSSLAQVQQAWLRIKAKHPRIRGAFGWSSETDRNAGWTFGNWLSNNK